MSMRTLIHVMPPDIYHRLGLSGMELARSAVDIRAHLVNEGRWEELTRYERDYVRAIQEGLDEVGTLRQQVLARAAAAPEEVATPVAAVEDAGLGELAAEGVTADGEGVLRAATEANLCVSPAAGAGAGDAPVSLVGRLVRQAPRPERTLEGYLASARGRVAALTPLSDKERARVAEVTRILDELEGSAVGVDDARRIAEGGLAALERDLSEGGDQRAGVFATYLALCRALGERPAQIGFSRAQAEIDRLTRALVEQRARQVVAEKVARALGRSGLSDQGQVVLDGAERRLLVAEGERECALVLSEDDAGSFVLTTVASADARTAGQECRARMEASARRLCSTKQRRLLAELEAEGLVASVREDEEVDLGSISYCAEFARLERERGSAERPESARSDRGLTVGGEA